MVKNMSADTHSTIVHGESPLDVAFEYAKHNHLPIGSRVEVVDAAGKALNFTVKRSSLSSRMMDGGDVQLVKTPLTGGGGAAEDALERDHIIHAQSPAQAAMLFAREANLPGNSYVRVSTQDGKHYQHYSTPSE